MKWLRAAGGLTRRNLSGVLAVAVAAGLVGTIFGLGATGQAPTIFDGDSWLWSRTDGELTRVSSSSGEVDLRQPVVDSRGHRVRVTQSDQFLFLHDLDTGRVTSVDLARMGFSGSLGVGTKNDIVVVLSGGAAAVVDRTRGLIRAIDPTTLQVKGEPLQLPAQLVGGAAFDGSGTLWVGLPGQGTVVGLSVDGATVAVRSTVAVTEPGHDLAVSVLDNGVLAVDRSGTEMVAVVGEQPHRMTSPVPLTGALLPDRTVGPLAAVTVPATQAVITIGDVTKDGPVGRLPLPKADENTAAVPFADRVYVPDNDAHTVHVYGADGKELNSITMPDAEGQLELEVREQHLFVNAPDSSVASVVDQHGAVQMIDKHAPDPATPAPTGSVEVDPSAAAPPPSDDPPVGEPTPGDPGVEDGPTAQPTPEPIPVPIPQPPGAPIPVTALAGDGQASLTWGLAAPGSAPVSQYTVAWDGGTLTVSGDTRATVVGGLTNGKTYRFRVTATNRYGEGPPALSGPVTPVDGSPPDAPGQPTATANRATVTVTWPAVDDAREYVVTPLRDGVAGTDPEQRVPGTGTEFTGLSLGKPYTFRVVAVDAEGRASAPSAPSNKVVPYDVPTVTITGTSSTISSVTVKFTVDNGGSTATCQITLSPSGKQATGCGGTTTFTGLTAGTVYTVKVTATNAVGSDAATAKRTTKPTFGGKVTCVDRASNPDPVYCTATGGIGVFTSPHYVANGEHHRVKAGSKVTVTCRQTGDELYAYVYNDYKRSNIWLKMTNGYWISWVWVTLDNGDKVSAVPTCN